MKRNIAPILIYSFIMVCCSASAKTITTGELLGLFKDNGYSIIYSTGLVDAGQSIEWDGELSIRSLERALAPINLGLNKVKKSLWLIERRQFKAPIAVSADLLLEPIDKIVVTASRYEVRGNDSASSYSIDESQLVDTPSFAGDSLRIIHRLPGAASIGVSSKPNVRGGASDELLVLFDGVELIEPFHLRDFQSMFSSFNPQTIQNIEYFTGGFPAQYGNKLSGVLDIATQDTFAATGGELGLSLFSASALLFTESGANRFLVSARRGNLEQILNIVNPDLGKPRYHDIYARYARQLSSGEIKVTLFSFNDDIEFGSDEARATSVVDNRYLWFEWDVQAGDRLFLRTYLTFGNIESKREGLNFAEDTSEGFLIDNQSMTLASLKHVQEFRIHDDLRIDYGITLQQQKMKYDTTVKVTRGTVAEFLGLPVEINEKINAKFDGSVVSGFMTTKFRLSEVLAFQIGLRYDRQDYAGVGPESQVSPRVSLVFGPISDWRFRFSYGRFYQPQGIYELETADLETQFSKPQKSDHWIAAAEFTLSENSRVAVEVFYKQIDDLKPRYENLFNPYVFTPELESDRITILADKAFVRGAELSYVGAKDSLSWNLNYTYSQAREKEAGRWIDRRWDQTHNFNIMVNWKIGNWTVGTAATWHTGWTFTKVPLRVSVDDPVVVSTVRSNARLKDYATLDAKIAYQLPLINSELTFFVEVTNLANRANKGGVDYEIELEDDFYVLQEVDIEPVFPLVINMGVIWKF